MYAPVLSAWEWFPDNNGLVSGIVFSAFGLSAFFWGFLTTYLINPENCIPEVPSDGSTQDKIFPVEVANRVPHCIQVLSIIFSMLSLVAVFGVSRNPNYVQSEKQRKLQLNENLRNHVNFITVKEAIVSAPFWQLSAMFFNGLFFCVYNSSVYKNNASGLISDHLLSVAGALGAMCNGLSSFGWGTVIDKLGFKRIYAIIMLIEICVAFSIYFSRSHQYLYILLVCCSFLCQGGHFSCFPSISVKVFGI